MQTTSGPQKKVLVAFFARSAECENRDDAKITLDEMRDDSLQALLSAVQPKLRSVLPATMIPQVYIPFTKMPLSAAAKLDRKRLRVLAERLVLQQFDNFSTSASHTYPTEMGQSLLVKDTMLHLWRKVLDRRDVDSSSGSNFFVQGADSMDAMKLVGAARKRNLNLTVKDIFEHPTLGAMAEIVGKKAPETASLQPIMRIAPFSLIATDSVSTFELRKATAKQCGITVGSIEDIFPCTPMQKALISLSAQQKGSHVARLTYRMPADLDEDQFCVA